MLLALVALTFTAALTPGYAQASKGLSTANGGHDSRTDAPTLQLGRCASRQTLAHMGAHAHAAAQTTTGCRNLSPLTIREILSVSSAVKGRDGSYTFRLAARTSNGVIISCGQGCSSEPGNVDGITYFVDGSLNVKDITVLDTCGLIVRVTPSDVNQPFKARLRVRFRRRKNNGRIVLERRRGFLKPPEVTSAQTALEDSTDAEP
jgi:hypothetical protein